MAALDQLIAGMLNFPEISRERWDLAEALLPVLEPFGEMEVYTCLRYISVQVTSKDRWQMEFDLHQTHNVWCRIHVTHSQFTSITVCGGGDFNQVSDILPHLSWLLGEEASDPPLHIQRYK